jgi:DNA-binding response OmpR family regulator
MFSSATHDRPAPHRILVIEDDDSVRQIVSRVLDQAGYTVTVAADGREGTILFHDELPDLVITDMVMPVQDGIETIRQIRAAQPEAKIIAISGGSPIIHNNLSRMVRRLGAMEFVSKPFDPDEFLETIARCLGMPSKETTSSAA